MISVVYCTRNSNPEHKEHLIKSSGLHKHLEVIEIINNGEDLTKSYNKGLKKAKNDIVVFCHDDLIVETKNWGQKLIKLFERNQDYGVIGVAGTKNMPVSGQWWEDRSKMYGRVAHTHEGKTWLSAYSDDLGQNIEETVIVDGLFFAIDKTKIKTKFNESVKGFHFYEITFCFENFLKGVKIGVTTMIRVNHMSIGMTNEQWETNRIEFAEKFKDNLPVNINKVLRKGEKLNIMLASITFNDESKNDKAMLNMAKSLVKNGHNVTIVTNLGGKLDKVAKNSKVKLASIQEPPGFKVGDGKWQLNTPNGFVPSVEKTLYKVKDVNFNIVQVFNDEIIEHFKNLYPETPILKTSFSDSLFLNNSGDDSVKSIELKSDVNSINDPIFINNVINEYVSLL